MTYNFLFLLISKFVVDRTMVHWRCPHAIPWDLWICYNSWERGITMVKQLTLKWGDYSGLPGWAEWNLKVFTWKRRAEQSARVMRCERDCTCPCWLWRLGKSWEQLRTLSWTWKKRGDASSETAGTAAQCYPVTSVTRSKNSTTRTIH